MMKMKNVLEVMADNLMNERLDVLIAIDSSFKERQEKSSAALKQLEATLTEEQNKLLDRFTVLENECSAAYARLSYKQGMKDIANLFLELVME